MAQEMNWNKKEEWPVPRSETELQELATMEFVWLDSLTWNKVRLLTNQSLIQKTYLCPPLVLDTSPVAATQLPMMTQLLWLRPQWLAQLMQVLLPPTPTIAPGSSKVKPIDLDTDNLASMVDTVYNASESSSNSSSDSDSTSPLEDSPEEDSEEDFPNSDPTAPPDDTVIELPEEDPDPVMEDIEDIPDSTTIPLSSVGVQQQTLCVGPPMALPMEPSNLGPASADLGGWA